MLRSAVVGLEDMTKQNPVRQDCKRADHPRGKEDALARVARGIGGEPTLGQLQNRISLVGKIERLHDLLEDFNPVVMHNDPVGYCVLLKSNDQFFGTGMIKRLQIKQP